MNKKECEIVKDLLPLYVDNVLSKSSKEFVEEHIVDCEDCKNIFFEMAKDLEMPADREAIIIEKINKRIKWEKIISNIIIGLFVFMVFFFIFVVEWA